MAKTATFDQIKKWVLSALEYENICDIKLSLAGKTGNGDGYTTEVVFIEVNGKSKTNKSENVTLNLVAKINKDIKMLEGINVCEREMYVYSDVLPTLRKFELEKGLNEDECFNSYPKCYKMSPDGKDVIVLENLRKKNYEVHDRLVTMNREHIETVLRSYAKYHAISFALRDQNRALFEKLTKDYHSMHNVVVTEGFSLVLEKGTLKTCGILKSYDKKVGEQFEKLREKNVVKLLENFNLNVPQEHVILHGDCWNNNFMFQYQNNNKESPAKVAILDWQLSSLHSPTVDLGYFLYAVSDSKYDEYLKFYHEQLSKCIKKLGSDPEKLFPYTMLMEHWKKYSLLGFLYIMSFVDVMLGESSKVADLSEMGNNEEAVEAFLDAAPKDRKHIDERLLKIARYFFSIYSQ